MKPRRIQLRRTKGWRMPENTVKVDRSTKWGNPFIPGEPITHQPGQVVRDKRHSVSLYAESAPKDEKLIAAAKAELRGKNLACWCPLSEPCHADELLKLAND